MTSKLEILDGLKKVHTFLDTSTNQALTNIGLARVPSKKQRNWNGVPSHSDDISRQTSWEEDKEKSDKQRQRKYENFRIIREDKLAKIRDKYNIDVKCPASASMDVIYDVKKQFKLSDSEVDKLEASFNEMSTKRNISMDQLHLNKEKKAKKLKQRCRVQ